MATTVIAAFNEFQSEEVNIPKEISDKAKNSRDWLLGVIDGFSSDDNFPVLYDGYNVNYGSFSRKTKVKPLDDIDIMIGLNGQGGSYLEYAGKCEITISNTSNLSKYCHDNSTLLNSRKIIEAFKSKLSAIHQYKSADIKRNQEALTLSLKSYDWVFDLVPTFHTSLDSYGNDYYLIPDGSGHWKKTNPKIDKDRVTSINQKNKGNVLNIIRVLKFWNMRNVAPKVSSYLLENIILDHFQYTDAATQFVDVELVGTMTYIANKITYEYQDPKGIQGNINSMSYDDCRKVQDRLLSDSENAKLARHYESIKDMKKSIEYWAKIFGYKFPTYG